jgi:hypothetical protein
MNTLGIVLTLVLSVITDAFWSVFFIRFIDGLTKQAPVNPIIIALIYLAFAIVSVGTVVGYFKLFSSIFTDE